MKRIGKNVICLLLSFALTFALAGCGASGDAKESAQGGNSTTGEKIVNIGVTDSLGGMNPLTIDQSWINVYAVGLEFLPLVQLDKNMNFQLNKNYLLQNR